MTSPRALGILAALLVSTAAGAIVDDFSDVQLWTGTGGNSAVMIIDWQDGKRLPGEPVLGQALAWGYRWPVGQTRKGRDMLLAIDAADPRLQIRTDTRSLGQIVFGAFYDLDGDGGTATFDTSEATSGGASDPDDHFKQGWFFDGFWGYLNGATVGPTIPGWNTAGGGFASRTLADGSWDAWVFSDDLVTFIIPNPVLATSAVPEPGTVAMLLAGAVLALRRRR